MSQFPQIKAVKKSGDEPITYKHEELGYDIRDFWSWSASDILSNATRGVFAEFIVVSAIGFTDNSIREEWAAYDLVTENGIKIEIKSAAFVKSWYQKTASKISFSVKESRYWDTKNNQLKNELKRHADLYIFCLLTEK